MSYWIFFVICLRYHSMLELCDCHVLAMVNILALELWQLLQYSYVCSSVMSIHLDGGGSVWDARVSFANVDMVSRQLSVAGYRPFPLFVQVADRW